MTDTAAAAIGSDPAEILSARALDVAPYRDRVRLLTERFGLELDATLFALGALPICLPRADHPERRRAIARFIAARAEAVRAELPALVAEHFAALRRPGRADVMREAVEPGVAALLSLLTGVPIVFDRHAHVSRIFSPGLGPARRRQVEAELRDFIAECRARFAQDDEAMTGLRLSLLILGRDALVGTLGVSLQRLVAAADGAAWRDIDWPATPPATGVPYIERVAVEPVTVAGRALAPGNSIRAELASYEAAPDPRTRASFFGAGAHLCLGRTLALDLWAALGAFLAQGDERPRLLTFALRRDDVFAIPERFEIEVALP